MLKIIFLLIISSPVIACETIPTYENIRMKEHFFSIGTTVSFTYNNKTLGIIDEKIISLITEMRLKSNGKVLATTVKELVSIGSKYDVYDCNNKLIGTIESQIIKTALSIGTIYEIFDEKHNFLAKTEMTDILQSKINIKNKNYEMHATRDFFNILSDGWTIKQNGLIDQRLVLFIPALKTLSDNYDKSNKRKEKK